MKMLSNTAVQEFILGWEHGDQEMRLGQAFHGHFKFDEITNARDKSFCDKLYIAEEEQARKMIATITDWRE